jgi:hypothetical protein
MMVDLEIALPVSPERVWAEVRTPRLLRHVAAPLITFQMLEPKALPEQWHEGRFRVFMWFLGFIPFGRQWIVTSEPPPPDGAPDRANTRCIRDNGTGDMVRVWDHWIFIRPGPDGGTLYRDRVDIKAGVLTPFVWLFAVWFYRHRQSRWRKLVDNGFAYPNR